MLKYHKNSLRSQPTLVPHYTLLTQSSATNQAHVEIPQKQPDITINLSSKLHNADPELAKNQTHLELTMINVDIRVKRIYFKVKIPESEMAGSGREWNPGHWVCNQCSATDLRQPDNLQPSQSPTCTAQVGLKYHTYSNTTYA